MKEFCVKGTEQACLNDRLRNAKRWVHTDLRAMEAKIYRIANMSLDYYFQDKRAFANFQRKAADAGFGVTPETSYMKAAFRIKQYMECYPDDSECAIDLLSFFLYPICKMSDRFVWRGDVSKSNTGNIKKTSANDGFQGDLHAILEEQHMREFYVWMNDYVQVLESIFPENDYLQCFDEEIYAKPPFEKSIPIVMKFVHTILYDKEEVYDKWQLLMKFMIEPYAGLYPQRQMLQNR